VSVAVEPHPQLGQLGRLIGAWEGPGQGSWAGRPSFRYRERATFAHGGKPLLSYAQQTWALDDGRPLHSEQGYWRVGEAGSVEIVLAHGIGVVEVELGEWEHNSLRTRSTEMHLTPTAKNVTGLARVFSLEGDVLRYTLEMALDGGPLMPHLSAELRRSAS
jgi:hypothetical protein